MRRLVFEQAQYASGIQHCGKRRNVFLSFWSRGVRNTYASRKMIQYITIRTTDGQNSAKAAWSCGRTRVSQTKWLR